MRRILGERSARILLSTTTLAVFGLLFDAFGVEATAAPHGHATTAHHGAVISDGDALVR